MNVILLTTLLFVRPAVFEVMRAHAEKVGMTKLDDACQSATN